MNAAFAADLARFGPGQRHSIVGPAEAQDYCSRLARSHYENFSVASVLLPRRLHRHFHNVYAYCRWADDLADETAGGDEALFLLRWWREELLRCYDGVPRHPVSVALRQTIRRFRIPPQPFLDLLSAFEQDQLVKHYASFAELSDYCRRSADPVGRLVLYLCEAFDDERARLADNVCTALQLTNFWQDVARDFELGRVYLPEEERRLHRYTDDDLHARRFNHAFAELLRFEVDRTRDLFYAGYPLVTLMPLALRSQVELFIEGGLALLRKIESAGYNVWRGRPVLSRREKAGLVAGAFWRRLRPTLAIW